MTIDISGEIAAIVGAILINHSMFCIRKPDSKTLTLNSTGIKTTRTEYRPPTVSSEPNFVHVPRQNIR